MGYIRASPKLKRAGPNVFKKKTKHNSKTNYSTLLKSTLSLLAPCLTSHKNPNLKTSLPLYLQLSAVVTKTAVSAAVSSSSLALSLFISPSVFLTCNRRPSQPLCVFSKVFSFFSHGSSSLAIFSLKLAMTLSFIVSSLAIFVFKAVL